MLAMHENVNCFSFKYVILLYITLFCSHTDIDECSGHNECEQQCRNLPGTFECTCEEGYFLQQDGSQCAGTCVDKSIPNAIVCI